MKTNTASSALWNFVKETIQEVPSKLPATVLALALYYIFPLAFHLDLLLSMVMLAPVLACGLVFLTQPKAVAEQTQALGDRHSMTYLIVATTISQASIMIQWAYLNNNHKLLLDEPTVIGTVLMAAGLVIRIGAIVELGKHFNNTIYIRPDHELIETGTYRYVRHGSYTGAFLVGMGIGIYFSAWWGVVISVIFLGMAYRYRIIHEEKALVSRFGDAYRAYQKRTKMLIPFLF